MHNVDKEQTHWDGCWFEHHKCALVRLERFERRNEVLERENKILKKDIKELQQRCNFLYIEDEKHIDLVIKIQELIKNTVSWEI